MASYLIERIYLYQFLITNQKLNMKRFSLSLILFLTFCVSQTYAQNPIRKGEMQLNFGLGASTFGLPLYIGFDYGIHENISIGPIVSFRAYPTRGFDAVGNRVTYNHTAFGIGYTGDFHFNNLLDIPREFDVYAGATISYFFVSSPGGYVGTAIPNVGVNPHVGGRYNFNPKWSLMAQIDAGTHSSALAGLTYKF